MEKKTEKKCNVCKIPYFERNNYFYGKLMTVRDFDKEQCYFNEKRWLINRMVSGWGVVCGLDVKKPKPPDKVECQKESWKKKVIVTPGLAIDCCGREILVCEEKEVPLIPEECQDKQTQQDRQQAPQDQQQQTRQDQQQQAQQDQQQEERTLAICLEYCECKTEAVHLPPIACDQREKCEFNRIRDSFNIRAIPVPDEKPQQPFCPQTKEEKEKSLHQYLCDKLRGNCSECPDPHCIILATVTVDQNGELKGEIDTCSRRRLVYNNPLLYDLIYCYHGDFPHVIDINWKGVSFRLTKQALENLRNEGIPDEILKGLDHLKDQEFIKEEEFLGAVKEQIGEKQTVKYKKLVLEDAEKAKENGAELDWETFTDPDEGIYTQGLKVTFDRKMNPDTINEKTFLSLVKIKDQNTGNYRYEQIPGSISYDCSDGKSIATFEFTTKWIADIYFGYSTVREEGGKFMVVLKGDFILSVEKEGKPARALDGNFIGGQLPSGNGTQGGDFVSWFSVEPKPEEEEKAK